MTPETLSLYLRMSHNRCAEVKRTRTGDFVVIFSTRVLPVLKWSEQGTATFSRAGMAESMADAWIDGRTYN